MNKRKDISTALLGVVVGSNAEDKGNSGSFWSRVY